MLRRLLYHLAPGGEYAIPRAALSSFVPGNELEAVLHRLADGLGRGRDDDAGRADAELVRATAEVRLDRDWIRIRKCGRHYLKLSDRWANRMLGSRSPGTEVRELDLVAAGTFASGTTVHSHGASRPLRGLESTVETPPLHLRHYAGRVGLVSNALTFTDNEILPDSFRHHLAGNLSNPRMVDVDRNFARIEQHVLPTEELAGSYYLLDSENSGHYGHLMTEVISRLWGWDRAKRDDPGLRAIFRIRYPNEREPALERRVLTAFGIAPEDVTWVDHPVYLESMYAATPMFHNSAPHYVHPGVRAVWERLRDGLRTESAPSWDRIFVSRRGALGNRRCLNREQVEDYFASAGFEVIYPEDHDLGVQASIFAGARVVAGFGGSAMFNALFADRLEHLIVLSHEAYTARNEALIALPLDVRLDYVWNRPEVAHPPGGWSRAAYKSAWTFDFDEHGATLEAVVGRSGAAGRRPTRTARAAGALRSPRAQPRLLRRLRGR
jgi:capsular polysaccharide biosynthesis protein